MYNKKVYVFLTDNVEETEAITVIDMLRRAEIEAVTVSITGNILVVGSHGIRFYADALFDELDFSDGDMLILPGGPGTESYKKHEKLIRLIRYYYDNKKYIAAICAAPTVFAEIGLLNGKTAVGYTDMLEKYEGINISDEPVVQDGLIVTSKGPATAMHFAAEIIEILKGAETAKDVCGKFLFDRA